MMFNPPYKAIKNWKDKFFMLSKSGIIAPPGVIIRVRNGIVVSREDTGDKSQGGRVIHE